MKSCSVQQRHHKYRVCQIQSIRQILLIPLDVQKLKSSGGFALLTPLPDGLPWTLLGALPLNYRYRIALPLAIGPLTRILLPMPLTSSIFQFEYSSLPTSVSMVPWNVLLKHTHMIDYTPYSKMIINRTNIPTTTLSSKTILYLQYLQLIID